MLKAALIIFIILWLLGFIHIGFLSLTLLTIAGHAISIQSLLYLIIILFLISLLPGIFRIIATVLFVLWFFSIIGFIISASLTNILLLIIIIAVIFSLF